MIRLDELLANFPEKPRKPRKLSGGRSLRLKLRVTYAVRSASTVQPPPNLPPVREEYGLVGLARRLHKDGFRPDSLEGDTFVRVRDGHAVTVTVEGRDGAYWAANVAAWMGTVYGAVSNQ
jgi:hypothetical protein